MEYYFELLRLRDEVTESHLNNRAERSPSFGMTAYANLIS